MDSPIYAKESIDKNVWTESEMTLFIKMATNYTNILTDVQTANRPLETYLRLNNISYFQLSSKSDINYEFFKNNTVFWREMSLTRPITAYDGHQRYFTIYLGQELKNHLDKYYNCIFSTGSAKAYLYRV